MVTTKRENVIDPALFSDMNKRIEDAKESVEQNVEWAETDEPFAISHDDVDFKFWFKSIVVPEGVEEIPDGGMTGSSNLEKVVFPSTLRKIGAMALCQHPKLREVIFKDGLETIDKNQVLWGNAALTYVRLPETLVNLGDTTFANCASLESIELPDSITTLGPTVFAGCSALKNVKLSKNLTVLGNGMFQGCESLEYINIPSSVTIFGTSIFGGCTSLRSIVIPQNLETVIDSNAFGGCTALADIYVPWAEDDARNANAPWGATNATIHYNYTV